jgi:hypothetical protein
MVRCEYHPQQVEFWTDYYQQQQTGHGLPIFVGMPHQRGAGIGSFFRNLFRMAVPVLKRAAKAVGKQAVATGASVLADDN